MPPKNTQLQLNPTEITIRQMPVLSFSTSLQFYADVYTDTCLSNMTLPTTIPSIRSTRHFAPVPVKLLARNMRRFSEPNHHGKSYPPNKEKTRPPRISDIKKGWYKRILPWNSEGLLTAFETTNSSLLITLASKHIEKEIIC